MVGSAMAKLSLSNFQVDSQVCEARMPQNFLFWDLSGRLWTEMARVFPNLKAVNANPAHTEFEEGDFLLVAEPGVLRVTAKGTVALDEFLKRAAGFFEVGIEVLGFELFERLGYRIVFLREFPSIRAACEAFADLKVLSLPAEPPPFGIKEPPSALDTRITWESEETGTIMGLRAERRNVEPQIPWELRGQIKATGSERFLLVIDVDRYTRKRMVRDQLSVYEWITTSHKLIRRSLEKGLFQ